MDEKAYFNQIKEFAAIAQKDLGQNFIIDSIIASRVINLLDIQKEEHTIEIGAGAGSLSYFLAQTNAFCDLIDVDPVLIKKLEDDFKNEDHVNVKNQNALITNYSSYDKIIGSLPYYITSGIVERVLLTAIKAKKIVFILQKEAVERLLAPIGSKDYSPLGVLIALYGEIKKEIAIPPEAFLPKPHVSSMAISITPSFDYSQEELKRTYSLASSLFIRRRKTIANNLKALTNNPDEILRSAGIIATSRPEQVPAKKYLELARILKIRS